VALAAALVAGAYLLGAVPFGLLVTRAVTGKDIRALGSGNIGATNVLRAAGRAAAAAVLFLDAAKGFVPVFVARRVAGEGDGWVPAACALAAVLGHVFPVYLRFRGGKGVATGLGVAAALAPWAALAGAAAYALLFALTRISSAGSLAGAAAAAAAAWITAPRLYAAIFTALLALIVFRHRGNIARLFRGEERPLDTPAPPPPPPAPPPP
jgi:glycerol-3-phosphate acyltransferase PlsY